MMKDVPVVIVVSKISAQNLAKHLVHMVQCVQTLIIAILTIKFANQSAGGVEIVLMDTDVMVGAGMEEGANALNLALSRTSVQAINTATSKMGNFTLIFHHFKNAKFTPIFFAILGRINIVKKNALKILTVTAKRSALMENVSLVVPVMITASKENLVKMANA